MSSRPGASASASTSASGSHHHQQQQHQRESNFSSVVQNLVRHQHGASAMDVPATDLDQYVADMLVKEAKERKDNYGGSAYLSDDEQEGPKHRPNKRFLVNMVKNVDDHNQALIRQEAREKQAAQDRVREQVRPQGRRSLFAQATGDVGGRRKEVGKAREQRQDGRKHREKELEEGEGKGDRRDEGRRRARSPSPASSVDSRDRHGHRSSRSVKRHREDSNERSSHRSSRRRNYSDDEESSHYDKSRHGSRRRSRSESRERSTRMHRYESEEEYEQERARRKRDERHRKKRRHSSELDSEEEEEYRRSKHHKSSRGRRRSESPEPDRSHKSRSDKGKSRHYGRSPSPAHPVAPPDMVHAAHAGPSKMDKYFTADYDPRLDVSLDNLTDPSTGLIGEGNFDEWSAMLDLLKTRRQEKNFLAAEREEKERDARYASSKSGKSKPPATYAEGNKAVLTMGGYAKSKKGTEWGAGPDLSF